VFRRVPLNESLEFVASPPEWERFRSFGDVTPTDLWVNSAFGGPGKLDVCDRLRSAFLLRVHENLVSGAWTAEGFDPKRGAMLQPIPTQLWRRLEFAPYEDEATGAGFTFVSLQMTHSIFGAEARARAIAGDGRLPLSRALEMVATEDELSQYEPLKSAALSPMLRILGNSETDYERRHRLCSGFQIKFWERILPKLRAGEWSAYGRPKGSIKPVGIPADLWTELECYFGRDEAHSGPELDLQFYGVRVQFGQAEDTTFEVAQPKDQSSHVPGERKRDLACWLRAEAPRRQRLVTVAALLEEVNAALPGRNYSRNMLKETLRVTDLREYFIIDGRPREKGVDD
jgi:hypothetical protein